MNDTSAILKPSDGSPVLYHIPGGAGDTALPLVHAATVSKVHDDGLTVDLNVATPAGIERRFSVPHESIADGTTHWDWHDHQVGRIPPPVPDAGVLTPVDGTQTPK